MNRSLLNLLITTVMTLIAFVPAVILYSLFSDNSAAVTWGGDAVKFGGPVAAFIGVFLILTHFYNRLAVHSEQLPTLLRDKAVTLAGIWKIESFSDGGSQAKRESTVEIKAVATGIELTGGSFDEPADGTTLGKFAGQWNCDIAFFDGHRLLYVYDLNDAGATTHRWRGLVDAQLVAGTTPPCFRGTWETLGGEYHRGRIVLTKQ